MSEIQEMFKKLEKAVQEQNTDEIRELRNAVNNRLFDSDTIKFNSLDTYLEKGFAPEKKTEFLSALSDWLSFVKGKEEERNALPNEVDRDFYRIIDRARYVDYEILRKQVIASLMKNKSGYLKELERFYHKNRTFWGDLNIEEGNFGVVDSRLKSLTEHWEDIQWVYEKLSDYRSRYVLLNDLKYWLTYDRNAMIPPMREYAFRDYFDLDLLSCTKEEVIADLGAYNGDTVMDYKAVYGDYKRFYCFEVSPKNREALKKNLCGFHDIVLIERAAGEKSGETDMYITNTSHTKNGVKLNPYNGFSSKNAVKPLKAAPHRLPKVPADMPAGC